MGSGPDGPDHVRAGAHPMLECAIPRARAESIVTIRWRNRHLIHQDVNVQPGGVIKGIDCTLCIDR
jgi:hypothetical protein